MKNILNFPKIYEKIANFTLNLDKFHDELLIMNQILLIFSY